MENPKEKSIANTRKWVHDQSWYRSRSQKGYTPSPEALQAYQEKYGRAYKAPDKNEVEELAAMEQIEMEDPEY